MRALVVAIGATMALIWSVAILLTATLSLAEWLSRYDDLPRVVWRRLRRR